MSGKKSRDKGKRGERMARDYLRSLGYGDARRGQQYSGVEGRDVVVLESLPRVHIEVKYGYGRLGDVHVSSKLLQDWWHQAEEDAAKADRWPVVLWKPTGARKWRLSTIWHNIFATVVAEDDVKLILEAFGNSGEEV